MKPEYEDIVKRHRPAGYTLTERVMPTHYGITVFARGITTEPLVSREALFTFLHECGHVHCRHISHDGQIPDWREEYEADQYAIKAMRAEGYAVPRPRHKHGQKIVRGLIAAANKKGDHVDDEEVLRYAFGRNWRQHK
jgi:hypothetical protein